MDADGQMLGPETAGQTGPVKYSIGVCVCVCVPAIVFGSQAGPDAVLGHALLRIKGLAL